MGNKNAVTTPYIRSLKGSGQKIVMCTAYDFTMAALVEQGGVDIILVGDSLGMLIQGEETTLPVTLDQMIYHCRCVTQGVSRALVIGDMPFMSYQPSVTKAIESAGRFLKEGRVSAVKLEGGVAMAETIRCLTDLDIPVMGHVGLTPQSYHRMGGHKIQGKLQGTEAESGSYQRILADAKAVAEAGAFAIVVEGVPGTLAEEISVSVKIPTIGIGAGPHCDGQVLVVNDLIGLNVAPVPSFVKKYGTVGMQVIQAVSQYASDVREQRFPPITTSQQLTKYGEGIIT